VLEVIDDEAVRNTIRGYTFVVVRFPLWPIARVPPEPLQSQNLFVIASDGKLEHLTSNKGLEEVFKRNLKGVNPASGKGVAAAWLRLSRSSSRTAFTNSTPPNHLPESAPGRL